MDLEHFFVECRGEARSSKSLEPNSEAEIEAPDPTVGFFNPPIEPLQNIDGGFECFAVVCRVEARASKDLEANHDADSEAPDPTFSFSQSLIELAFVVNGVFAIALFDLKQPRSSTQFDLSLWKNSIELTFIIRGFSIPFRRMRSMEAQ